MRLFLNSLQIAFKKKKTFLIIFNKKKIKKLLIFLKMMGLISNFFFLKDSYIYLKLKPVNHINIFLFIPRKYTYYTYEKLFKKKKILNETIVLNTFKGILSHDEAIKLKIGGQVLFTFFL